MTTRVGAVVGGTVGDSAFEAQLAGVIGQNAVENNEFSIITQGTEKVIAETKKKKELQAKWTADCKNKSCVLPIDKSFSDHALELVNNLTVRQLAAVMGAEYDPVSKEKITPNEREDAKAAMLSLGFSKALSGPIKLTDNALTIAIEKKYGKDVAKTLMEPEADFAGRIPIRPRDVITPQGTNQINTPLGNHLINGEIGGRKNAQVISGGHNADNFYEILNTNHGKIVGKPTQIANGITDVKYQLPNGRIETKTIYDPKVYSDAQMATMANQAAAKAIRNYGVNGKPNQIV